MKRSRERKLQVAAAAILLTLGSERRAEAVHDPIAHWRFDEAGGLTALDSSGFGHNGALISAVAYTTSGLPPVAGNVSALNIGNYGWVSVPYHPDFDFGPSDALTVALWVKPTQLRDPYHVLGKRLGSNINFQMARDAFNLFHFGTNTQALSFGQDLPQNAFTHVAVTYDGATLRLYLDGTLVNSGPFTMDPGPPGTPLEIASTGNGTITRAQNFPGVLDDLRIYRRVLGPSEISALAGVPPVCVPPPSGLVGWWPGDGNATDIVNGRNGTLVGGAGFAPGQVAQAFTFTPAGWVDVPDDPAWTLGANDFSIDIWTRFSGLSGRDPFIAHDEGGGSTNKWIFWYDASGHRAPFGPALRLHVNSPTLGPIDPVVHPWTPTVGRWYHLAVTRKGFTYTLYIDGDPVISETDSRAIPDPSARLTLGRAEGYFLNGLVDEVEIHQGALAPSEVHSIFVAGIAGKCKAPVADAGPDQSVDEGSPVALDGTQSTGLNLTYSWVQLAGEPVGLDDPASVTPTFTAPGLAGGVGGNQTLTFALTVTDALTGLRSTDTVDVAVKNLNHPPTPDAGVDQNVNEGSQVGLDAGPSYDPDGDAISCQWNQACGTVVALHADNTCQPSFTAPLLAGGSDPTTELLCFEVTVSDGELVTRDGVLVTVEQVNHPPAADAGPDQTRDEGTLVSLNGRDSQDPDGDTLAYSWNQVGGPPVVLSDVTSPTPGFTAPLVGPGGEALTFRLTVNDGGLTSEFDDVVVTVRNLNDPPACQLAQASPAALWPPNHKMVPISITGVSDSNQDPVTITTTAVTQDEPVNGLGDGDTSPDAVVQESTLLRAERAGGGNGRVYQVRFTADDGQRGVCSGTVTVAVPKSMKPGQSAIDDGQTYDSTQP